MNGDGYRSGRRPGLGESQSFRLGHDACSAESSALRLLTVRPYRHAGL